MSIPRGQARRAAAAAGAARAARQIDPRGAGGAVLLGLRQLGVVAARLVRRARASRNAIERRRARRRARTSSAARYAALDARGRAAARARASDAAASVPDRHDPGGGPRRDPRPPGRRAGARPGARSTSRRTSSEDLEADSLDLYTLVQELEDTYGVEMSDEQAARIHTVGQAVDFVLAQRARRPRAGP